MFSVAFYFISPSSGIFYFSLTVTPINKMVSLLSHRIHLIWTYQSIGKLVASSNRIHLDFFFFFLPHLPIKFSKKNGGKGETSGCKISQVFNRHFSCALFFSLVPSVVKWVRYPRFIIRPLVLSPCLALTQALLLSVQTGWAVTYYNFRQVPEDVMPNAVSFLG